MMPVVCRSIDVREDWMMDIVVPGENPDSAGFVYDEFGLLADNCAEFDLPWSDDVDVARVETDLGDGRVMSGIKWGSGEPRMVFIHGGAQNAHTWDTVALMLRPLPVLAIDLPGHGHSSWRADGGYDLESNAADVARMMDEHGSEADVVVAMSLGGLTANVLAATYPWLVRRLVVVDITPGVNREKAAAVHAFIEGPQTFDSFAQIFERTVTFNPTRSAESLKRGILHNAHRRDDGTWQWNYDRGQVAGPRERPDDGTDPWDHISDTVAPYLLLRGALSPVVDDEDVAELMRRRPDARVRVIDGAGHSIQGDQPAALVDVIREELNS